jgi:hypothetical protein
MIKSGSCTVGLADQWVRINSYGQEGQAVVDFICRDLSGNGTEDCRTAYDLLAVGSRPMFSLWQGDKQLYFGADRYDLAYTLVNEIIYQCIAESATGHALHAAALGTDRGGILMPGKSGSGKSTLTAWLVSRGCNYLTDELVLLTGQPARLLPFTRPISIKDGSREVLASFFTGVPRGMISGTNGCMVAHRLLHTFVQATPPAALILFPRYLEGAETDLQEISPARACAGLIECFVNARNIEGHGIGDLARLTRNTPAWSLTYSSFSGLYSLLQQSFAALFV